MLDSQKAAVMSEPEISSIFRKHPICSRVRRILQIKFKDRTILARTKNALLLLAERETVNFEPMPIELPNQLASCCVPEPDGLILLFDDGTILPSPDGAGALTQVVGISAGFQHNLALVGGGPPALLQQPLSFAAAVGRNARLAVSASGTQPMQYQWRKDGHPVPGATAPVLALDNLSLLNGGNYNALVSNSLACSRSTLSRRPRSRFRWTHPTASPG
jgi:hypothetical protein